MNNLNIGFGHIKMEKHKIKTAVVILNWNGKYWLDKFLLMLLDSVQMEVIL